MGTRKLNLPTDQRKALLRNLVTSFLETGRIETTLTRAKEKMIIVTSLKDDVIDIYDSQEIVDYITRSSYKSYQDASLNNSK